MALLNGNALGECLVDLISDNYPREIRAFLPRSLAPIAHRSRLSDLLNTEHDFETKFLDHERRNLVVTLEHEN